MSGVMSSVPLAPVVVGVARGGSDAAVRFGAREARRTGRQLDLVHVAPVSGEGWLSAIGRDSLRVAASRARSLVTHPEQVRTALVRGIVVPSLVEATEGAALAVLEHRRPGVLRAVPDDSTSAAVAGCVDVPVVVVPQEWVEDERDVVTLGLDPERPDIAALQAAIMHARLRCAVLRVVSAMRADGCSRTRARLFVDDLLAGYGADACDVAVEVSSDPPEQLLADAARSSDLLVLGRHRPGLPAGTRLSALTRHVLLGAACPVLLTAPAHVHQAEARSGVLAGAVG